MLSNPIQKQNNGALDLFYDALAYKPWCGDDKLARLVRPKESAAKKAYIAPNPPEMVHWLVFDLDHANALIWEDNNLPPPNLIVRNPGNGRSHLYYAISPVCISVNARSKPVLYMKAVARGMAKALNADESYNGRIAKNPLCPEWRTTELHADIYNLDELADYVDPISKPFKQFIQEVPEGRNNGLFYQLRHWAYGLVKHYKANESETAWHEATLNRALAIATIQPDFTYNEIKNTAKSVAKWTWANYTGSGINRGIMGLADSDIPLSARQRLAARRTHEQRSNATEARIKQAIKDLTQEDTLPSKAAVAERVGISRQQIYRRYSHLFNLPPREAATRKMGRNLCCTSDNSQGREVPSEQRELGHYPRENKKGGFAASFHAPDRGLDRAARQGQEGLASVTYLPELKDEGD